MNINPANMTTRLLSLIAGVSYLIIFFAAVFANFMMLESLQNDPLNTILHNSMMVRTGIMAFMITVVFDVVVAWALFELFQHHPLIRLSTYFRLMHAAIMAVATAALPLTLLSAYANDILQLVNIFNTVWLTGLFFFGIHLILLGRIIKTPGWIALFLIVAGIMYMADTAAHFLLPDYKAYSSIFLALVAIPSIIGEMSFAVWLMLRGGKTSLNR